jgi:energy-coupling factor transporter ATP-binding protein EcfA2
MFEADQICPYTGLRSFTEEESLYFKGREDDIDQATQQLQRNKFLMLTGASGDGKSSLIYAGIVPNARAGFLKSKYTQWCVADFRPERTPFHNLCKAIARQLGIANAYTVQAELNHGFSAIIDLYKNSKRYIDTNSVAWQQADDKGKAALKREAANLIILVDQFEEFFTNPENYHKGVPSRDANLVLNLLLETARIALDEDLPIYIVFTMRSDYIGQCAAFRGLPEYIGFSQFFVPRLNRTQLQQVIEEPAVLSGNRITRRLTERLIHDLTEGVDQLPIVQHALNQVWHAADNGKEEMDLIHYAMVGGMPVNELPDEQVDRFKKWYENLPDDIKACYHKPNLQNVLDTHTNKLYEQAEEYYLQKTGKAISDEDAKTIIRTAFICLTKIDQSRAVRNRMTLKEITNIIGRPEFNTKVVGKVLDIFREPGNTFIRPFIREDTESRTLSDTDVLDITHESLIRNWEYLGGWAKEEFENYTISLDFEQQLNRWVDSDKSKDFLLSIGQLTYFENWFNAAKPNAHWIARYLPEEIEQDKKLLKAREVLNNAKEFLSKSAGKHVVTRTIMRYGAKRIAAALAVIAVIVLSSFAIRDYFRKQNDYVLKEFKKQTFELANISKLSPEFPIPVITEQLILGNLTIPEIIGEVKELNQKIKISTGIATQLVLQGRYEPQSEILQSLTIADSLLEQFVVTKNSRELSEQLKLIHDFSVTAGFAYFFNPNESLYSIVTRNAKRSARWALYILKEQPKEFNDIQLLSLALDNGINNKIYTSDEISELINILSPFENTTTNIWIMKNYQRDKILVRGFNDYGPRFNGLFQDLAYLYAAAGKTDMVLQCMDTLLQYQAGFFQNDLSTHVENASHIAAVFYIYEKTDKLNDFVNGYCNRKKISTSEFYSRLVSWSSPGAGTTNFYAGAGGQTFANMSLQFSSDKMLSFFFQKLKEEILKIKDIHERNFTLSYVMKNEGAYVAYRKEIRGVEETETNQLYKDAVSYYLQVSNEYLEQSQTVIGSSGSDLIVMPRKFLFLYPDYRVPFHPLEPRSLSLFYYSSAFIKYVLDNNLFDSLYKSADDFKFFELWLLDYQNLMPAKDIWISEQMPLKLMEQLAAKLEERKANLSADLNILYLHLSNRAFDLKETDKGIAYIKKIQSDKLLNAFKYKLTGWVNNYSFELTANAIANLTVNNQFDLAYRLLNVFKKEVNRSSLYAYASQLVSLNKQSPQLAQRLLDSALIEKDRIDNSTGFQPNRQQIAIALMYLNPEKNSNEAYRVIKNSGNKFVSMTRFSRAFAVRENLYKAQQQAPSLISAADKAYFLWSSIDGFNLSQNKKKEWQKFKDNKNFFVNLFLPYINENQ